MALEADVPAFMRKGVLKAVGSHSDFASDVLTLREHGTEIPQKVNQMGHYVRRVVAFGDWRSKLARKPGSAAAYLKWAPVGNRPDLPEGG